MQRLHRLSGRIRKRRGRKEKQGDARGERIWEGPKELLVCRELEGNDEGREEVEGVLKSGEEVGQAHTFGVKRRTFRKGRPRLVVFIMCEEDACGEASYCCIVRGRRKGGGGGGRDGENEREGEGRKRAPLMR